MSRTKTVELPKYRVEVRHPVHGWQVVEVIYQRPHALRQHEYWVGKTGETMSVTVTEMDPHVAQAWMVLLSFTPENKEGLKHST